MIRVLGKGENCKKEVNSFTSLSSEPKSICEVRT